MVTPQVFLKDLGLSPKEVTVYLALLRRGPSSVRELAQAADVNRGTTYDILKSLQEQGVVSFYDQDKKTYFSAEDPGTLKLLLESRQRSLDYLQKTFNEVIPQLSSIASQSSRSKPVARYYHGAKAIRSILLEVLADVGQLEKKEYFVYSSSAIAQHLYEAIPDFTKRRIKEGISVHVIAYGSAENHLEELSERRWLDQKEIGPTYTIIFGNQTAFISLDDRSHPHGVIIEDINLAESQRMLFQSLWKTLPK